MATVDLSLPVSLYIHLPWCLHKCAYCDFNSHQIEANALPEEDYCKHLIQDIHASAPLFHQREVQSIFIGGGTPSLFSAHSIEKILLACQKTFNLNSQCEITLESNPGTFEYEKFAAYMQAGVNRLSLGIQSFNDHYLKALDRIHSAKEALSAIDKAKQIGFQNMNIDLMFGLPEQSLEDASNEIQLACELDLKHISYYQLTLEPNTVFHRFPPKLPDENIIWDMHTHAIELLSNNGLHRYEVSAFSKAGSECLHNKNYWQYGDYLGLGAGAHSKISNEQGIWRFQRPRQPSSYIKSVANHSQVIQEKRINSNDLIFEFMLNHLRLVAGFTIEQFCTRTGLTWESVENKVQQCLSEGMLEQQQNRFYASELGYRFLDELVERFLPEAS